MERQTFDVDTGDVATGLVRALQSFHTEEYTEPSLYDESVDMDSVQQVLDSGEAAGVEVSFSYRTTRVTISGDGKLVLEA